MKVRIVAGFVLGILFLFLTLQSFPWVLFALLFIHVFAQLEFSSLIQGLSRRVFVSHILCSSIVMLALSLALAGRLEAKYCLALAALLVVAYSVLAVLDFERQRDHRRFILLLRSILFISLPLSFIPAIISAPQPLPLYLLLIGASWGADTGAIFAGKACGHTPLAPRISPKKTVEGALGGMLSAGLIYLAAFWLYAGCCGPGTSRVVLDIPQMLPAAVFLFLTGALLSLVGLFGDLTFSLFKREAGIKDYSLLIPGHGGILDRFDSMLFVAPLLYLLSLFI